MSRSGSREGKEIWNTDRHCDVLWSNDSRRLAITDWAGSNCAEIYLIDVTAPAPKARQLEIADIGKLLHKEELEGHCYFEALAWEGEHRLRIKIFGHADEKPLHGFTYYLSVDTRSGEATLLKKEYIVEDIEPSSTGTPACANPHSPQTTAQTKAPVLPGPTTKNPFGEMTPICQVSFVAKTQAGDVPSRVAVCNLVSELGHDTSALYVVLASERDYPPRIVRILEMAHSPVIGKTGEKITILFTSGANTTSVAEFSMAKGILEFVSQETIAWNDGGTCRTSPSFSRYAHLLEKQKTKSEAGTGQGDAR